MKPLRGRGVLPRPEFHSAEPDFRGLRRILAMFIVGVVVCAAICATTIIRDARRQRTIPRQATACTCMGACLRRTQ
jgi:hypothetical protein